MCNIRFIKYISNSSVRYISNSYAYNNQHNLNICLFVVGVYHKWATGGPRTKLKWFTHYFS